MCASSRKQWPTSTQSLLAFYSISTEFKRFECQSYCVLKFKEFFFSFGNDENRCAAGCFKNKFEKFFTINSFSLRFLLILIGSDTSVWRENHRHVARGFLKENFSSRLKKDFSFLEKCLCIDLSVLIR